MAEFSPSRQALIDHLKANAVLTNGPFTLRSGVVSSWYIDARRTTFSGEGSLLAGTAVAELLPAEATAVGGMTMGADPIAVATAIAASMTGRQVSAFSIRKEIKDHGTGGRVVGPIAERDRVVVLEDTTTTGSALIEAIGVLRAEGVAVIGAIALVDRSDGAAAAALERLDIPYLALATRADLGVEA
ncbi:MAG: orotate phosphoribosyltransferase [Acidimicrobiia bacterium]